MNYAIEQTEAFAQWFASIKDAQVRARLARRLDRAACGLLGDVKRLNTDAGVWEMREDFGAGWRMYYILRGKTLILMLGGGGKRTQNRDIAAACALAKEL